MCLWHPHWQRVCARGGMRSRAAVFIQTMKTICLWETNESWHCVHTLLCFILTGAHTPWPADAHNANINRVGFFFFCCVFYTNLSKQILLHMGTFLFAFNRAGMSDHEPEGGICFCTKFMVFMWCITLRSRLLCSMSVLPIVWVYSGYLSDVPSRLSIP